MAQRRRTHGERILFG